MASPQVEDGFVRVQREVLDALCQIRIPGQARQVFDVILRQTWGWKKKEDHISLEQFQLKTGLSRKTVVKVRKRLVEMNLISVTQKGDGRCSKYRINKDFESWIPSPKKVTSPNRVTNVPQFGEKRHPKSHPQKKKENKENISRSKNRDSKVKDLLDYFHEIYLKKHGVEPNLNYGKDGKLAKTLLGRYPLERIKSWLETFFYTDDTFIDKAGNSFGVFFSQVDRLATKKVKPPSGPSLSADGALEEVWRSLEKPNNGHTPTFSDPKILEILKFVGIERFKSCPELAEGEFRHQWQGGVR